MKIEEYEAAAEAILFAMGDSVELKKLAFALQVGEREAELIVRNLATAIRHPTVDCRSWNWMARIRSVQNRPSMNI